MRRGERITIAAVLLIQTVCAVFFVSDILLTFIGIRTTPIAWQTRELLELGAAFGLVLGVGFGAVSLARSLRRTHVAESQLRLASAAFGDLLNDRFDAWDLTPAERDVALFSVKGFTTAEIAALRDTSEGTVKAQTSAIYRKAGVNSRAQLLSHFVEILAGDLQTATPPETPLQPPAA